MPPWRVLDSTSIKRVPFCPSLTLPHSRLPETGHLRTKLGSCRGASWRTPDTNSTEPDGLRVIAHDAGIIRAFLK
jgi:hypothetical protein